MSGQLIHVDFKKRKRVSVGTKTPTPALTGGGPGFTAPTKVKKSDVGTLPNLTQIKLQKFSDLISRGRTEIILDATRPGVIVPEHLYNEVQLTIAWSLKFGLLDFDYDEIGVSGTLSFARQPFYIFAPWESVWAIRGSDDDSVEIWEDSLPKSLKPPAGPVQQSIKEVVSDAASKSSSRVDSNFFESFFRTLGTKVKRFFSNGV